MGTFSLRLAINSILSSCSTSVDVVADELTKVTMSNPRRSVRDSFEAFGENNSSSSSSSETIVVALDASKGITDHALKWTASNLLKDGDCIIVLAMSSKNHKGKKLWGFPMFAGECAAECTSGPRTNHHHRDADDAIKDSYYHLVRKLCSSKKVQMKVRVIQMSDQRGVLAMEAKKLEATWIVLDRQLKREGKACMDGSLCNVVLVTQMGFKILCLNLKKQQEPGSKCLLPFEEPSISISAVFSGLGLPLVNLVEEDRKRARFAPDALKLDLDKHDDDFGSSPDAETPFTATERGTSSSSSSSSERGASPLTRSDNHVQFNTVKDKHLTRTSGTSQSTTNANDMTRRKHRESDARTQQLLSKITPQDVTDHFASLQVEEKKKPTRRSSSRSSENLMSIQEANANDGERTSSVRKAVSLPTKRTTSGSPPLCSICQYESPVFGRPPRRFTYDELEFATGGFCKANFLAEGGYGSVHRGVLDGTSVAVKQYKLASSQGDNEFCSEVEVLSCAQHRNVVMLIGYCIEKNKRLLVYEFVCNGSLDSHLYGKSKPVLKWPPRQKIAVGAARGLRYLHEECRVGCIVHRDMRPNNILVTHDFEPMVGDFGLARWQPDGDLGVDTRVIGTLGYLAPEYAQTGQITEKADVYSFGVVLLELVTGRKAIDINRPKGQQCLTEWARVLLEEQAFDGMIDPQLGSDYNQYEAFCMLHTAALCIQREAHLRPRMSQVLRMLEGDLSMSRTSSPLRSYSGHLTYSPHSNSGRLASPCLSSKSSFNNNHNIYEMTEHPTNYMTVHQMVGSKLSLEALKAAYKHKI